MANAIYKKYKEALLSGDSDTALTTSNVVLSLVDFQLDPTIFDSTDEFYSDLNANTIIDTEQMTGITVTDGIFAATNTTFTAVDFDDDVEALLIWINTGTANTSRLVAFLDTDVTGLPITPANNDVTVSWNASGIFQL